MLSVCACMCVSYLLVEEEEADPLQCGRNSSGDETALLLPEHTDAVLRYELTNTQ